GRGNKTSMNASIPILSVVIGAVVLLFGRKLFWLCVAAIGFAAGVTLASHIANEPTALLQLTFALLLGFIGALLALFLQKLAIGLAGCVAGGRLAVGLMATFFVPYAAHYWLVFVLGGIIGALALLALFDWAVIFISSLIGAHLIANAITLPETGRVLLFAGLVVLGIIVQVATFYRASPAKVAEKM